MSPLYAALALILSVETKNMDNTAIGDLHLPVARRSFGRMQVRKTVLDDLNNWDKGAYHWTQGDSHNPNLDILIAARWLRHYCGAKASVKTYCQVWNGGPTGRNSPDAQAYYKRALAVKRNRPEHFRECVEEVNRRMK